MHQVSRRTVRRGGRWRFGGGKEPRPPRSTLSYAAAKSPNGRVGSDGVHYSVETNAGLGSVPTCSSGVDRSNSGIDTGGPGDHSSVKTVTASSSIGAGSGRSGTRADSNAGGGGPRTPASGRKGGKAPTSVDARKGRQTPSISGLQASRSGSAERAANWAATDGGRTAGGDRNDVQGEAGGDAPGDSPQSPVMASSPKKAPLRLDLHASAVADGFSVEASWSPSPWDRMAAAPPRPATPSYLTNETAGKFVVGIRLLAGSGEGSDRDAQQLDCGAPIESFDAFRLAQRPDPGNGDGSGSASSASSDNPGNMRLLGAFTNYQVPYRRRRMLSCGPPDFISRCLAWPAAATDGGGDGDGGGCLTIGVRINWAGAGAPY